MVDKIDNRPLRERFAVENGTTATIEELERALERNRAANLAAFGPRAGQDGAADRWPRPCQPAAKSAVKRPTESSASPGKAATDAGLAGVQVLLAGQDKAAPGRPTLGAPEKTDERGEPEADASPSSRGARTWLGRLFGRKRK